MINKLTPLLCTTASKVLFVFLLLSIAIVATYHRAPDNSFHFDDYPNIVIPPAIHITEISLESFSRINKETLWTQRPLPNISFAIDWWRGGGKPEAFQWTNIFLHAITTLLAFAFILTLLRRHFSQQPRLIWIACFGAALWALHPIQTQAVTYIVQRMASMAALFSLLAVFAYIKGRLADNKICWGWFALSALAFVLGTLCKENTWVIPAFILLAEFGVVRHKQPLIQYRLDYLWLTLPVIAALYLLIDIASGAGPLYNYAQKGYALRDFTLGERLLTQPRVIAFHLSQILWPWFERFSLEHDFVTSTSLFRPATTFFALLGLLIWCGLGLWLLFKQNYRIFGFLLLWVPLTLAVESSVIALEMIFEHRMYLPSILLAALAAFGIAATWQSNQRAAIGISIFAIAFLAFCIFSTMQRIPQWKNEITLLESALDNAPNSVRNLTSIALYKIETGLLQEGLDIASQATKIKKDDPTALKLLGLAHTRLGNFQLAEQYLTEAYLLAGPTEKNLLSYLGELYLHQQRYTESHQYLLIQIQLQPASPYATWNIAQSFERLGNCNMALHYWKNFINLSTDPKRKRMAGAHLQRNYQSSSGKCFQAANP